MDDALGDIVSALKRYDLYDNTVIIFTSDNGAAIKYSGSNWPLRGTKVGRGRSREIFRREGNFQQVLKKPKT